MFAKAHCLIVLLVGVSASLCMAAPPPGYYLLWSDEFNGASLDTSKWALRLGGAYRDGYNTLNAVSFNGSNMVITTYTQNGTNFTAMLYAKGKFEAKYGYWEANIKWGDTNAEWSSPFLLSRNYSLNASQLAAAPDNRDPLSFGSEIDICEHRYVDSSNTKNISPYVQVNVHWKSGANNVDDPGSPLVPSTGGLSSGFHAYGFLWKSNSYSFLVDGSQVYSNRPTTPVVRAAEYPLLTSCVDDTSTTWAGLIPPGGYGSLATSTTKYTLDYFRYYAPTNVLYWTGSSSAYWNNPANWASNYLPAAGCDLTFSYMSGNRTMSLGQDYSANSLIFIGANGPFTINAGNTLTLGAGGIDMISANNNVTLNNAVKIDRDQWWIVGANNPSGGLTLTDNGGLSGGGALTKAGYGTLVLGGANAFSGALNVDTGTTNNDGILRITSSVAVANVPSVSIRNTGTGVSSLQLSGGITMPQNISLAGRSGTTAAIESLSANNTIAGGLTLSTGGNNYLIQSDSGYFNLGGTISAGSTATGARTLLFQGAGSFNITASIQNGSASPVNLVRTNAGVMVLSGTNTCTGGTTNWCGTLFVNGSVAGPLTVNGGALSGAGRIGGNALIQSGGQVSPGAASGAIGTLTFGSNLTFAAGSTNWLKVNSPARTNDTLLVTGTLTCGGTLVIADVGGSFTPGDRFQLFQAGMRVGSFSSILLPLLDSRLAWNTNSLAEGVLSVIAVNPPERISFSSGTGTDGAQLNWDYGTLQSSGSVAGPYVDITNATSPYLVPMTNRQQFYRVREN